MMDDKKKPAVPQQENVEELSDAQLSQINGGITMPTIPSAEIPDGLKLGQALKKNTSFTKADDRPPSANGG